VHGTKVPFLVPRVCYLWLCLKKAVLQGRKAAPACMNDVCIALVLCRPRQWRNALSSVAAFARLSLKGRDPHLFAGAVQERAAIWKSSKADSCLNEVARVTVFSRVRCVCMYHIP
jgi:hypothetical protein